MLFGVCGRLADLLHHLFPAQTVGRDQGRDRGQFPRGQGHVGLVRFVPDVALRFRPNRLFLLLGQLIPVHVDLALLGGHFGRHDVVGRVVDVLVHLPVFAD